MCLEHFVGDSFHERGEVGLVHDGGDGLKEAQTAAKPHGPALGVHLVQGRGRVGEGSGKGRGRRNTVSEQQKQEREREKEKS